MNKYNLDEIKDDIINACNNSSSMAEASSKLNMNYKTFRKYALLLNVYKTNIGKKGVPKHVKSISLTDILNGKYPNYQTYKLKNRIIKNNIKPYVCESCGLSEWLGYKIPLELHHIDGNEHNHLLSNLQLLCPNCHTFTDNYRGKQKIK